MKPAVHVGGHVLAGARSVTIGDRPAARRGDPVNCQGGSIDEVLGGEPTVLVEGRPAARLGDATRDGELTTGLETVEIGPPERLQRRPRRRLKRGREPGR